MIIINEMSWKVGCCCECKLNLYELLLAEVVSFLYLFQKTETHFCRNTFNYLIINMLVVSLLSKVKPKAIIREIIPYDGVVLVLLILKNFLKNSQSVLFKIRRTYLMSFRGEYYNCIVPNSISNNCL